MRENTEDMPVRFEPRNLGDATSVERCRFVAER
jgi:hypothetical protein